MIDHHLFTVADLIGAFLGTDRDRGHRDWWKLRAEIMPRYKFPHQDSEKPSRCVVRYGNWFLRHSAGPMQGHFWDSYGDDYLTPGLALRALFEAPIVPSLLTAEAWER